METSQPASLRRTLGTRLAAILCLFICSALPSLADSYSITVQPGYNLIANQLDNGGNTVAEVLPTVPDGTVLYLYPCGGGFSVTTYFVDLGGWDNPSLVFAPGQGAALFNPEGAFSLTFSGTPHVPVLPINLCSPVDLVSRQTNDIGTYENIVGLPPDGSNCGPRVFRFNAGPGRNPANFAPPDYTIYTFQNGVWNPQPPSVAVGEAVWITRVASPIPLSITSQPLDLQFCDTNATNCAMFSVAANGTEPLNYQWYLNGAIIPGATESSYTYCPVVLADSGNQYTVTISDFCGGSVTSQVARLTVKQDPDTNAPVLICPPDLTVQSDADVPVPDPLAVLATDDCSPSLIVEHVSDVATGRCPKTVLRTYRATDASGNVGTCIQTITVSDTIPPVFLCPSPGPNLVPNPGFESYSACPITGSDIDLAVPWFQPTVGTSDFLNRCAPTNAGTAVPISFFGNQEPHSGDGYAGGAAFGSNYREYIETPLLAPLVAGQTYEVSFYVSLSEMSVFAVDNLGAHFSVGAITNFPAAGIFSVTPQVRNPPGTFLSSTNDWMLIRGAFTAAGGENYVTIGNFRNDLNTPAIEVNGPPSLLAYYFIDDVSVRVCESCLTNKTVQRGDPWTFDTPAVFDASCGTNVTLVALDTVTNGICPQLVTRIWQATDCCSNNATCSQTVTILDRRPPALSCPAGIAVCADPGQNSKSNVTFSVTATDNCLGVNVSCDRVSGATFPVGATTVHCLATNAVGSSNGCSFIVLVNARITGAALTNLTRCRGDSATFTAVTSGGGALSYAWSLDGGPIGTDNPLLIVSTGGLTEGSHTVQYIVSGECGSVTNRATLTVQSCASGGPCSFTQGFYGNAKGKFNGTPSLTLISNLLATGPLVVGKTGTRSLTIPQSAVPLLQQQMPASTTPVTLPNNGDQTLPTAVLPLNKGKFANILLGQTITLSLNVRLDPALSGVQLRTNFCTQGVTAGPDGSTGTADDLPVSGDVQMFAIPNSVLAALINPGLGINDLTVRGLLELANRALAGLPTGGASLSDINSALDNINRGFDGCRILVDCATHTPLPPSPNDSFGHPTILTNGGPAAIAAPGKPGAAQVLHVEGFNCEATKESGEPAIAGNAGGKSVWWQWQSTISGWVTIQTAGSTFDTLLAVFKSATSSNLKLIAASDDTQGSITAQVTFQAVSGETYLIGVDGVDGACGKIDLQMVAGAPRLTSVTVLPGAGVAIGIEGELGRSYVVEGSADLMNWEPIAVVENSNGTLQLIDRQAKTFEQRFYRVWNEN
jgi:HYR domain